MEEYRAIVNFSNYEVSNHGNVRNKSTNKLLKFYIEKSGYLRTRICQDKTVKAFYVRRLVAIAFLDNPNYKQFVDHINNDTLNNHYTNLRFATTQEQMRNRRISKKNTTGVKGITYRKSGKWEASIKVNGKTYNLGQFKTLEDAKLVRMKKATEIFGEFVNDCEKQPKIKLKSTVKLFKTIDDILNEINQLIHL